MAALIQILMALRQFAKEVRCEVTAVEGAFSYSACALRLFVLQTHYTPAVSISAVHCVYEW